MKNHKKLLAFLLAFVLLFSAGCASNTASETPAETTSPVQEQTTDRTEAESNQEQQNQQEAPPEETKVPLPDKDGYYYDVENVVLYLHTYGTLPSNYITKSQAQKLGWSGGSVQKYQAGAAIGGDSFGNKEGLLPKASGLKYTECDIDTDGEDSRGAKRLIFSNDGHYYYTDDHYESFTELTVDENNEIIWKK